MVRSQYVQGKCQSLGICVELIVLTFDPAGFDVLPAIGSPLMEKSLASTILGSLQVKPLRSIAHQA